MLLMSVSMRPSFARTQHQNRASGDTKTKIQPPPKRFHPWLKSQQHSPSPQSLSTTIPISPYPPTYVHPAATISEKAIGNPQPPPRTNPDKVSVLSKTQPISLLLPLPPPKKEKKKKKNQRRGPSWRLHIRQNIHKAHSPRLGVGGVPKPDGWCRFRSPSMMLFWRKNGFWIFYGLFDPI